MKKPIDCFDACDDFFMLVIEALVLTAAMETFEMQSLQSIPSVDLVPEGENSWMLSEKERRQLLDRLIEELMDSFFTLNFYESIEIDLTESTDMVHLYAKNLLSLGLFYWEYGDSIKEGDGSRVRRCCRYMLPMFISSGRRNYAIEIMQLLMQYDYLLSPREAEELMWARFINVHGCIGRNIPNDLHMEHLNRICKTAIRGLGSNKSPDRIQTIGNALGTIAPVLQNFDEDNEVPQISGNHNALKAEKDLKMVIGVLQEASVFSDESERSYSCFPKPRNPLHSISCSDLTEWIVKHISF